LQKQIPPSGRNDNRKEGAMKHYATIIGAFVGGAIGATIGGSLHHPAMWLPLGIGIGLAIGIEIRERHIRNLSCHPERSEGSMHSR
jgi:uncharacterized membrane protein YoaK (UPF0700 family)